MFTVKWIVNTPFGEQIRIFEAKEVAVAYRDKMPEGYGDPTIPSIPSIEVARWELAGRPVGRQLLIMDPYEPNFAGRSFDVGTVYVMNESGATVGKYVLDPSIQSAAEPLAVSAA